MRAMPLTAAAADAAGGGGQRWLERRAHEVFLKPDVPPLGIEVVVAAKTHGDVDPGRAGHAVAACGTVDLGVPPDGLYRPFKIGEVGCVQHFLPREGGDADIFLQLQEVIHPG